ncbi:MAG: phosphoribosyltransferase [Patescibacteria group bacterium]
MNFVSIQQLERDVLELAYRIPPHSVVAGVENSGMLPARILANRWNVPAVPFREVAGKDGHGVLVVDDSLNYGGAMRRARNMAGGNGFHYAAVYLAEQAGAALVDYHCRVVPRPRFFQWNTWKHDLMASACIDMDGVICEDCTPADNDDGPKYAAFLEDVKPLHIPSIQVAAIVTGRLEKYRKQTEAWLAKNGVSFGKLFMMPLDTPAERRAYGIARFKSEIFSDPAFRLFIESAAAQAKEIAERTKKPVLLASGSEEWRLM